MPAIFVLSGAVLLISLFFIATYMYVKKRQKTVNNSRDSLVELMQDEIGNLEVEDEDDSERTEIIDTLAYHQPPKHVIAEKAKKLAES